MVLNGLSHLKPTEHDVHDYAIHRLEVDAGEAIDAPSTEAIPKPREALRLGRSRFGIEPVRRG
jgi:hypothetical protein